MSETTVVLPIGTSLSIDQRYDDLLAMLNEQGATIHMIAQAEPLRDIDPTRLSAIQREQMTRMAIALKCEALDNIAHRIQARFPNLVFEYHADTCAVERQLLKLSASLDARAVIIDSDSLPITEGSAQYAALQSLVNSTDIPIWHVNSGQAPAPAA